MSEVIIPDYLPSWIKDHVLAYLEDGKAAHDWDASLGGGSGICSTLLLSTVGRKSGNISILPLIYRPTDGGGYCIIASKGGAPTHPAWFLNLQAQPLANIKVADTEVQVRARVAQGQERDTLWQLMSDYYSPFNDYQAATDRQIPVVVLDPV